MTFRRLVLVGLAAALAFGGSAPAQWDAPGKDDEQLRSRTETIITSPEFRHLRREGRRLDLNPSNGASGGGSDGISDDEARREQKRLRELRNKSQSDKSLARRLREWSRSTSRYRNREREARERAAPSRSAPGAGLEGLAGLGAALGPVFHGLAWVLLGLALAVIVWLIARAVRNYERKPKSAALEGATAANDEAPDRAPGDVPADEFIARGRELAAAGRYREAVAYLLLGAMSQIERAGLIRFRRGLTHRDYLRAVRSQATAYGPMSAMVSVYEPLGFGRREATRDHFDATLSQYEAGFRATAAVAK